MQQDKFLSVIGIGLGPANLALATAIAERQESEQSGGYLFLERQPALQWHPDMMLPGAKLQVPFLRDLATLRNPCSPFTFLNYLKANNRLDEFINLRTFYPSRLEFHDYLNWVAQQFSYLINYSSKVEALMPIWDKSKRDITAIRVTYSDQHTQKINVLDTENIVLGIGKKPFLPACANNSDARVIHTANFLQQIKQEFPESQQEYRFIIVGSGQSAGETALYLLNHYPAAKVKLCFRSYTLRGIDSGPYINRTYHQAAVDEFFTLDNKARKQALDELKHSNYSVIDNELLTSLYECDYASRLQHKECFTIQAGLQLKAISYSQSRLEIVFDRLFGEGVETHAADGLILATGYTSRQSFELLKELDPYLMKNSTEGYQIARDYRLNSLPNLAAGIYVQGNSEESHGPSDGTLAILATRAETILDSLLSKKRNSISGVTPMLDKIYAD